MLRTDAAPLLTVHQVAARLGLKPNTIRIWIRQRRLACFKFGPEGHGKAPVRIPESEIARLLEIAYRPCTEAPLPLSKTRARLTALARRA